MIPGGPSAHDEIALVVAESEAESVLADLLNEYAHELSTFHRVQLEADGRFVYRRLPSYWREPGKTPFLVRVGNAIGGFVLVNQAQPQESAEPLWDIAEFFVAPEHRRKHIGIEVAHLVWRRFPGPWQVRVLAANCAALRFWEKAIGDFTGAAPQCISVWRDGDLWCTFRFESLPKAENC